MNSNKGLSLGFELLDIEIIDHKKEPGLSNEKWNCDECSLFFLSKDKLIEHKNKHVPSEGAFKCKYCNKTLSIKEVSKECYANRKCNTCEYKCSKCTLRFQRHSSFVNHEKSHLRLKRKKVVSVQKRPELERDNVDNVSKKRHSGKILPEQHKINKLKVNNDINVSVTATPKKKRKTSGMFQNEKSESQDTKDTVQTIATREMITNNKKSEENTLGDSKQNTKVNLPTVSVNTSHESTVNYKPFSCHICGENFASGDSLLLHIQTHGENVSKGFKCKHCSDEFEDIYKMQYHLAICPLAEDETTLVKHIPPKFHITPSSGVLSKRGRPKKIKSENPDSSVDYDLAPSLSTRGSIKKRNQSDETSEIPKKVHRNLQKYSTRSKRTETHKPQGNHVNLTNEFVDSSCDYMSDNESAVEEDPFGDNEKVNDPLNDSYELAEEGKPKVHSCPFPRCGIKFSREKALLCHMRNHNDDFEDSYKCHKCDIPFDDIHSLRLHLNECKDIKGENEDNISEPEYTDDYNSNDKSFYKKKGDYTCNICGQTYLSQEKLKRHLALHGSSNFICRICKDLFINQSLLDEHFIAKHPHKSSYHCDICNEDFISELFLTIHESEYHAAPISSESIDPTRDSSFVENDSTKNKTVCLKILKSHSYCSAFANNRLNYDNKNQFWCPVCFKCFDLKESMRLHFHADHIFQVDSVYICEVCETEKPTSEMLCYHLEMHSGNLLSVNRFSPLRACVYGKEGKSFGMIPNKSVNKTALKNEILDERDSMQLNKIESDKGNVVQKNVKVIKRKYRKKCLIKVKKGLQKTDENLIHKIKLDKIDNKNLKSKKLLTSNKLNRVKNVRNNGTSKLSLLTDRRKSKINRNKRLPGRKQTKPCKKVQNNIKSVYRNQETNSVDSINSTTNTILQKHIENNSESIHSKSGHSSDEENIHTEETVVPEQDNESELCSIEGNTDIKHNYNKGTSSSEASADDKMEDNDDSCSDSGSEEICCSMCAMTFYRQDELLDHVATHI